MELSTFYNSRIIWIQYILLLYEFDIKFFCIFVNILKINKNEIITIETPNFFYHKLCLVYWWIR